jgi:hypothetical protein
MEVWGFSKEEVQQLTPNNAHKYQKAVSWLLGLDESLSRSGTKVLLDMGFEWKRGDFGLELTKPKDISHLKTDWVKFSQRKPPVGIDLLIKLKQGAILTARCSYAEWKDGEYKSDWSLILPKTNGIYSKIEIDGDIIESWTFMPK